MKKMKGYHDLCLKTDVLLLADAFKKCRNNSLKNYEFCPIHYLSRPALTWDAMLNMTKVKSDMCIFFAKVMRWNFLHI